MASEVFFHFLEEFMYTGCYSLFDKFISKAIWAWAFHCRKNFKSTNSVFLLIRSPFRFSVSSYVSFCNCVFLGMFFILSRLSVAIQFFVVFLCNKPFKLILLLAVFFVPFKKKFLPAFVFNLAFLVYFDLICISFIIFSVVAVEFIIYIANWWESTFK